MAHLLFSRIDHRTQRYAGCECQCCTPTGRPTTARFWVYYNSGLVRVKLRKNQMLGCCEGGQTDEGYSYTGHSWLFDGEDVCYSVVTNARDCDGPISHGVSLWCKGDELAIVSAEDCDTLFPNWQARGDSWQRDYNAERAGY